MASVGVSVMSRYIGRAWRGAVVKGVAHISTIVLGNI